MNILLIEDNVGDVILIQQALEESGYLHNLNTVHNGEIAIAYLQQYEEMPLPDIIFLDINLPRKDGFEVLQAIKNNSNLKNIPVIIITSSSDSQDKAAAASLGARGFLSKPSNFVDYTSQLKEMLAKVLSVES